MKRFSFGKSAENPDVEDEVARDDKGEVLHPRKLRDLHQRREVPHFLEHRNVDRQLYARLRRLCRQRRHDCSVRVKLGRQVSRAVHFEDALDPVAKVVVFERRRIQFPLDRSNFDGRLLQQIQASLRLHSLNVVAVRSVQAQVYESLELRVNFVSNVILQIKQNVEAFHGFCGRVAEVKVDKYSFVSEISIPVVILDRKLWS